MLCQRQAEEKMVHRTSNEYSLFKLIDVGMILGSEISYQRSHQGSEMSYQRSHQKSEIRNQRSEIRNQRSEIRDQTITKNEENGKRVTSLCGSNQTTQNRESYCENIATAGDKHDSKTSTNNRNHEETLVSNNFDPKRSLFCLLTPIGVVMTEEKCYWIYWIR